MRICKTCGTEFNARGRALQICADCRVKKDIEKEQEKNRLDAEKNKKSTLVAVFSNGLPTNDFLYFKEELHHTGNTYHLYCEGGAMSKYCKSFGKDTAWGERVYDLTKDEAIMWLKKHNIEYNEV